MKEEIEDINKIFFKKIKKENGFKTPSGYFEQSKASVLSNINVDFNFFASNNKDGFTVPNNYFETSKFQILSKINTHEAKKVNLFTVTNWQFVSGIAAIFIAIILLFIFLNINKNNTLSANLNKASEAEMIEFLTNNDVKIEWINELNLEVKTVSKKDENNKEIEQYLLEHADEQALLDEL